MFWNFRSLKTSLAQWDVILTQLRISYPERQIWILFAGLTTGSTYTPNSATSNKFVKDSLEFAKKDKLYQCEQRLNEMHNTLKDFAKVERLEAEWSKIKQEFTNELGNCVKGNELENKGNKIEKSVELLKHEMRTEFKTFDRLEVNYFYSLWL